MLIRLSLPFQYKCDIILRILESNHRKLSLPFQYKCDIIVELEYITILDVKIPLTVVPVKPGRNLAVIIECAAMNNRQKKMGYNAARELLHQLGMDEGYEPKSHEIDIWQNY